MTALRLTNVFSLLAAAGLALLPLSYGVSPPPDGGYANANRAEGRDALLNLGTAANNTALGYIALQNRNNVALGYLSGSSLTTAATTSILATPAHA